MNPPFDPSSDSPPSEQPKPPPTKPPSNTSKSIPIKPHKQTPVLPKGGPEEVQEPQNQFSGSPTNTNQSSTKELNGEELDRLLSNELKDIKKKCQDGTCSIDSGSQKSIKNKSSKQKKSKPKTTD
jgi:hypothetical protein